MAVTYAASLKTTRMNAVVSAIDAGAGASTLEIGTSGFSSVLAVLPLADPCGSVSGSVLTLDTSPALEDSSANATGTAAEARIKDGDGNVIVSGLTVGTSGADINLNKVAFNSGDVVQITSGTITHG